MAEVTHEQLVALESTLPKSEMLYPHNRSFERALFAGNLLHRLKTPIAAVWPGSNEDVVKIVRFCSQNKCHLTVKNGGHSYAGYSLNDGGIVMNMGRLDQVVINSDRTEVTIAAGATWKKVYNQLVGENKSHIVVGGQCPHVGVSGFMMGGGLSPFSRQYGLAIDNVVAIKVVTAEGEIKSIRRVEKKYWDLLPAGQARLQRLFWAICGGGGGNFGVLLEFTSRIHKLNQEDGRVVCGELSWDLKSENGRKRFKKAVQIFNEKQCASELTIDGLWRANGDDLKAYLTVIFNGTMKECEIALGRILYNVFEEGNHLKEMLWSDWVYTEDGWGLKNDTYHRHLSFVLGKGKITEGLIDAIHELMESARTQFHGTGKAHFLWGHIGGATADKTKYTPFPWREGEYVCNLKLSWNDSSKMLDAKEYLKGAWDKLHVFALDEKAAYLNYIDSELVGWQTAYYGDNYGALQDIKKEWDPNDFFHFDQAIELRDRPRRPVATTFEDEMPLPRMTLGDRSNVMPEWAKYAVLDSTKFRNLAGAEEEEVYGIMVDVRRKHLS